METNVLTKTKIVVNLSMMIKIPTLNNHVKRLEKEANELKRECESLKADIKYLKLTIHEQPLKLSSITHEHKQTKQSRYF